MVAVPLASRLRADTASKAVSRCETSVARPSITCNICQTHHYRVVMAVHIGKLILGVALFVVVAGCNTPPKRTPDSTANSTSLSVKTPSSGDANLQPHPSLPPVAAVQGQPPAVDTTVARLIMPGDRLSIRVDKIDELTTDGPVNAAGAIVMPVVGPVQVAGLTPDQAREHITQFLATVDDGRLSLQKRHLLRPLRQ